MRNSEIDALADEIVDKTNLMLSVFNHEVSTQVLDIIKSRVVQILVDKLGDV